MEMWGDVWRCVEMCGDVWRCVEMCGDVYVWRCVEMCGDGAPSCRARTGATTRDATELCASPPGESGAAECLLFGVPADCLCPLSLGEALGDVIEELEEWR